MRLEKGVSIYLIVIIVSTLLAVSLNVASLIIGGAKIISNADDSVKAFYSADTGIEAALYQALVGASCSTPVSGTVGGNNKYYYSVVISYTGGGCNETGTTMISNGEYRPEGTSSVTKRKISISF
jgi:hypothetical protein